MDQDVERAGLRRQRRVPRAQKLEDALVAADEVVAPGVVLGVDRGFGVGVKVQVLKVVEDEKNEV